VIYVLAGELDAEIDHLSGRLSRHDYVHVPAGAGQTLSGPAQVLSIWTPARG
jgi:glyoxylate utilization-related uncharacterized protein